MLHKIFDWLDNWGLERAISRNVGKYAIAYNQIPCKITGAILDPEQQGRLYYSATVVGEGEYLFPASEIAILREG